MGAMAGCSSTMKRTLAGEAVLEEGTLCGILLYFDANTESGFKATISQRAARMLQDPFQPKGLSTGLS